MADSQGRQWSAFIAMPLNNEFSWVFDDLIRPSLEAAKYSIVRADSVVDQQNIMKDIVEGILRSDLIIAEISSLNPNVMYELGMSHALQRPTIILTQDVSSAPFDLKAYRLIPYSDNYKEMASVKAQLTDLALKHRNGEITFGSPVTDFAPQELRSIGQLAASVSISQSAAHDGDEEYHGRPGLLDRQQEVLEQSETINRHVERIAEITHDFGQNLENRTAVLRSLAEDGSPDALRRVRLTIVSASSLITRWSDDLKAELPPIRGAWRYFEEAADGLVSEADIQSDEDKRAAVELISTMEEFRATLEDVARQVSVARDELSPIRRISRDLDRAGKRADDALADVVGVFSEGEAIAIRLANVLRNRLEEDNA